MRKLLLSGLFFGALAAPAAYAVSFDFDAGVKVGPLVRSLKREAKRAETPKAIKKARPAKKLTICFLRGVKKDVCVYRCRDGSTYRVPVREPDPWDDGTTLACSQIVIPF
jgi:hypothetical protein